MTERQTRIVETAAHLLPFADVSRFMAQVASACPLTPTNDAVIEAAEDELNRYFDGFIGAGNVIDLFHERLDHAGL